MSIRRRKRQTRQYLDITKQADTVDLLKVLGAAWREFKASDHRHAWIRRHNRAQKRLWRQRDPDTAPSDEPDHRHYWLIPPDLFAALHAEFDFDFDACSHPRPAGFDGLLLPWGYRTWCNPPFVGRVSAWVRKALAEYLLGRWSVILLPIYQSRAIATLCDHGAVMRYTGKPRFLRWRTAWLTRRLRRTPKRWRDSPLAD